MGGREGNIWEWHYIGGMWEKITRYLIYCMKAQKDTPRIWGVQINTGNEDKCLFEDVLEELLGYITQESLAGIWLVAYGLSQ